MTQAQHDQILRAMTDDGSFRVLTIRSTQTARGVLAAQKVTGNVARLLADLTTSVVLIRETMAPSQRVQGMLKGPKGQGYLLADSHPAGATRGLCKSPTAPEFPMEDVVLSMMRTLQNGKVHQGFVQVDSDANVSRALMGYMQESEQITTMLALSSHFEGEDLVQSGGYLVQLLPGAATGMLAVMTERLEDFRDIDSWIARKDFDPQLLMDELLYAMPHTALADSSFESACWCSRESMMTALASLPKSEVQEMVDDGELLEIDCDYCYREYRVSPNELRGLLDEN